MGLGSGHIVNKKSQVCLWVGFDDLSQDKPVLKVGQKTTVFSLMMDEMAICQHVQWDCNEHHGFIDMGTDLDDDCLPLGKKALTLMAVSHKLTFKVPVGYFFIYGR